MISERLVLEVKSISKYFHIMPEGETPRVNGLGFLLKSIFQSGKKSKELKCFHALNEISFSVKKGESLGIIGLNGSGKSTLLQIISGTMQPSKGSVAINGRVAALLELGSGFDPQFSGRENIILNASLLGLSKSKLKEEIPNIEKFADIGNFIDLPVSTYSSGMCLRLAFAVIAHTNPDILIIDEALAVGDGRFVQKCFRFLNSFKKKGNLLMVSHDVEALKTYCSRTIWIHNGEIVLDGDTKYVADKYLEFIATSDILLPLDQKKPPIEGIFQENRKKNTIECNGFGNGQAKINRFELYNAKTFLPSSVVNNGELLCLRIDVLVVETFNQPVFGFVLRNRLGIDIVAFNTDSDIKYEIVEKGKILTCMLKFYFPHLVKGEYAVSIAVAKKNSNGHEILNWIHDAIIINVSNSSECLGLVGLEMEEIIFSKDE